MAELSGQEHTLFMQPLILHILSADLWGGAEAQVLMQVSELRSRGQNSQVMVFSRGGGAGRLAQQQIPFHVVEENKGLAEFLRQSQKLLVSLRPKILVAHGYKEAFVAYRAARSIGCPWVNVFHGLTEGYSGAAALRMCVYQAINRSLAKRSAARIVTVSEALARDLGFAGNEKLRIIRNVSRPIKRPAKSDLKHPAIVAVGRLASIKRPDLAIEAFERLCKRRSEAGLALPFLYLIGDGPLREELSLKAAASAFAQQIELTGFVENAAEKLAAADLLLITSDSEGIPTVLLEAASAGVPAVTSEVGGIPEVLRLMPDYSARTFPPGDAISAAERLNEQLEEAVDPERRAKAAEQFERFFLPSAAAEAHISLYSELLENLASD